MLDKAAADTSGIHAPLVETLAALATLSRALRVSWLSDLEIEVGQDMLLSRLDSIEAVCVSDLANQLQVRPSTVSKMLDRVMAKGWCERIDAPHDKRRTLVRLTASGSQAQAKVNQMFARGELELTKALSTAGGDMLMLHLEETRRALQHCVDRIR